MADKKRGAGKRRALNFVFCVFLSLLIGFVSTYSLFFFAVDSYKYSSDKWTKSFSEISSGGFDASDPDSIARWGRQSNPTSSEASQIYSCLKDADYKELPLVKAFPLFWIAFTPKKYICNLYFDGDSDFDPICGFVYVFNGSVYLLIDNGEPEPKLLSVTVYKATKIDAKTIQEIGGMNESELKLVGTKYQYLYSKAIQKDWYFHYVAIFIAMSFAAYILISIVRCVKRKR